MITFWLPPEFTKIPLVDFSTRGINFINYKLILYKLYIEAVAIPDLCYPSALYMRICWYRTRSLSASLPSIPCCVLPLIGYGFHLLNSSLTALVYGSGERVLSSGYAELERADESANTGTLIFFCKIKNFWLYNIIVIK